MKFRKCWKRFWTLDRHHAEGFTLVELIVVIAILAILAGVGTVGYSGYITATNKGNDKTLVGNVMRAVESSAYSYMVDFNVAGQYSDGLQIPVGFIILSDETLAGPNGETGTVIAISNDTEIDPLGKSLEAAMGANYGTAYKLSHTGWEVGTIGGSSLHNATVNMLDKINSVGDIMIALQSVDSLQLSKNEYNNTDEMLVAVAHSIADYNGDGNINDTDKTAFVQAWLAASNQPYSSIGFGLDDREEYSAVRLGFNNAFAEYVRANYSAADANTVANNISNYGQSAGQLAYDKVIEKLGSNFVGKLAAATAKEVANNAAKGTTFPYVANANAFENDSAFPGYGNQDLRDLYDEWIAGPAATDAALFYETMVSTYSEGEDYSADNNDGKSFVNYFAEQAQAYSDNLNAVQSIVNGKNAIVVVVYYTPGEVTFDVYSSEADPRND